MLPVGSRKTGAGKRGASLLLHFPALPGPPLPRRADSLRMPVASACHYTWLPLACLLPERTGSPARGRRALEV